MNESHPPKPKRRWYQFSLRTLLVVLLLFSLGLSWFAVKLQHARRQRKAVEVIRESGGTVIYGIDTFCYDGLRTSEPLGPAWRRTLFGDALYADRVEVFCGEEFGDSELAHLTCLDKVELLRLTDTQVTDAGLKHLRRLKSLRILRLPSTKKITDAGVAHVGGLATLESLNLAQTQVTDAGLEHLKSLMNLSWLILQDTEVTDEGLNCLEGLTKLEWLDLRDTEVTDEGLERLEGLTDLEWLLLDGTNVTDEGVKKLQEALPNCKIVH